MAVNVNAKDARATFLAAKAKLKANNIDVDKAVLSSGYLQTSVELSQTSTQYTFPVLANSASAQSILQAPTDQRLQLQDAFFVSSMGFFLQIPTTTDGVTISQYKDMLLTFPSGYFYPDFNILIMRALWNAYISITVNQEIVIPFWDTQRHLKINQTQYPTTNGGFPINAFFAPFDEVDGSTDGYYPVEPNIILWGSGNNVINFNLPQSLNTTGVAWTGSYKPRIVLKFRGVLAQNCTTVAVPINRK